MKKIAIAVLIIALAALCGFQTYNVYELNRLQARLTFQVMGLQNVMSTYCKRFSEAAAEPGLPLGVSTVRNSDAHVCNEVLERSRRELGELHGGWFKLLQEQIRAEEIQRVR
jgi:hypothetical protein